MTTAAYRALLALCSGVGAQTARQTADACLHNGYNFRALFHAQPKPHWLIGRPLAAVTRVDDRRQLTVNWELTDTVGIRGADIAAAITQTVFVSAASAQDFNAVKRTNWHISSRYDAGRTSAFLRAASDRDREAVMAVVQARLETTGGAANRNRAEMDSHDARAKGLSGKVALFPGRAGHTSATRRPGAAGLVIEQRRLLYVSPLRKWRHASFHTPTCTRDPRLSR